MAALHFAHTVVMHCHILKDLIDGHENGRRTIGIVAVTEACIDIAESHDHGGAWLDMPLENRDLYVFHDQGIRGDGCIRYHRETNHALAFDERSDTTGPSRLGGI
jgi:hypothetical protein